MVSVIERYPLTTSGIPEVTVPPLQLGARVTERVTTENALNYSYLREQLDPNTIAQTRIYGNPWRTLVPYAGYSQLDHLMLVDWTNRTMGGPENVPTEEGEVITTLLGKYAETLASYSGNDVIVWGWNWSPRSFGQRGYQSIPTKWHPSVISRPSLNSEGNNGIQIKPAQYFKREERLSVSGDFFKKHFGELAAEFILGDSFSGDQGKLAQILCVDKAYIDSKGLKIPTRETPWDTLFTPGIFGDVLKPIAERMDQIAVDLSLTLTDFDTVQVDRVIADTCSNPYITDETLNEALAFLKKTPNLLPVGRRAGNIEALEEKGYPEFFIRSLQKVNMLLGEGPITRWKRGFAYSFGVRYDQKTGQGYLAITSGIVDRPGGIVEDLEGIVLRRPNNGGGYSPAEIASKIERFRDIARNTPEHSEVLI